MIPNKKGEWLSTGKLRFYSHLLKQEIVVPRGTVNNLASIPKPLRSLINVNGPHRPAAALHDYLYQVKGKLSEDLILSRSACDKIFLEAMETLRKDYFKAIPNFYQDILTHQEKDFHFYEDEPLVGAITAKTMYLGVRVGGGFYWN